MRGLNRCLVTGGAGFLGSHLCDRLLQADHTVICLDDFSTGHLENIAHLIGTPRFSMIRQDIADPIRDLDVDRIYNLACPASPVHYQADPIKTMKTSVLGILNVLDLAERTGARLFHASTSEIYGDPEVHPQPESYLGNVNSIGIRACYDEGKRCAETLCMDYHRCRGVDIRMVRIFNTYGPRMALDDGRVVSNFVAAALTGRPLEVYGDGSQTRSFCYVDDLIEGFVRLMEYEGPECHLPHNLGNPGEFTIRELADVVSESLGVSVEIAYRALPADDPKLRRPEISRATTNLNWQPTVPLTEGVREIAKDFRRRLSARGERLLAG